MPFFNRDLRDAVRFFGFPNARARRTIVLALADKLKFYYVNSVSGTYGNGATTPLLQPQSSTLAIIYTLSILSFPALFHFNLKET